MKYNHLKKTLEELDEKEQKYIEKHYPTNQVYKGLGLTRDALRYYEELGILMPEKNQENSYREYTIYDIWNLLVIDFYKKRGITPKELKAAKEAGSQEYYKELLLTKKNEVKKNIKAQKKMLKKLEETLDFNNIIENELNVFRIKDFPLYELQEEISSINNFEEYGKKLLEHVDMSEDDIYSNIIKVLLTDDKGYTGSKGYLVKRAARKIAGRQYLEGGEALYVAIEDKEADGDGLMEEMFTSCMDWAERHGRKFKGTVYVKPQFIYLEKEKVKVYLECWVPLQN